ncbi:hypothetical protein GW17_00002295 [Ensete ventricosum]|uniref:Uncharacterized protein n=1 Tax=Ensete ventricosum TaxID=4639 RepID=A0A427B0M9_ENSVE|nr:hypothetical protein B296_00020743 [Ensete ventricosum]RWW33015.1 hypothetical protein GW17_00002295 [Ensete ventricosum]RZR84592.1 hypothetical protein BHM03_00011445 [Ensete ventricosum]
MNFCLLKVQLCGTVLLRLCGPLCCSSNQYQSLLFQVLKNFKKVKFHQQPPQLKQLGHSSLSQHLGAANRTRRNLDSLRSHRS